MKNNKILLLLVIDFLFIAIMMMITKRYLLFLGFLLLAISTELQRKTNKQK